MAVTALTDAFIYVGDYDFTTDTNNATLTVEAAQLDATTFNSGGCTEMAGGLKTSSLAWSGFWSVDGTNDQGVSNQGFPLLGTSEVYTFGPVETAGSPAYMLNARKSNYSEGGEVGGLLPFSLSASATSASGTIRGQLAKARGTVSATGAMGSAVQLGAVGASEYLYGSIHVLSAGTTVSIALQSDDNVGFSSPTVRASIGPLTTTGATWVPRVAGAITDDYFRFVVTAITGSFTIAAAIGKA